MKKFLLLLTSIILISNFASAQQSHYLDNRPSASLRMPATDAGIVMRYGDGPDSCDTYGAREAVVNKVGNTYYLFYDGAGKTGWLSCLATSNDLQTWTKKGAILTLGDSTKNDSKSASSPWVVQEGGTWHMFYLGTPNTTPAPYRIPSFPYLTMKAQSQRLEGPWVKQYNVTPLPPKEDSYYTVTSSPGYIVKTPNEYVMFFSGATLTNGITRRTLGIARTKDLNVPWVMGEQPIVPLTEQVENSSVYFEPTTGTWFLFTYHIGITKKDGEYTDAVWVYWSKDLYHWDAKHKAVVLDGKNCTWAKGAIGMPSVIPYGNRLALLYDAPGGTSTSHMLRNIGLAWLNLPLKTPQ